MDRAKIDVHGTTGQFAGSLETFLQDDRISATNRELVAGFLRACALGKTVLGRQKKKIGERRLLKYLYELRRIALWLDVEDFRRVAQAEMERFILALEEDRLTVERGGRQVPARFAAWTKRDLKMCLRKFYKWLLGESRFFPDLVAWIDTSMTEPSPESLSLDEIRLLVEHARSLRDKALVWTLFETGARAEEFLNIRLEHVEDKEQHLAVRIEHPKTYRRVVPVFEGAAHLRRWLAQRPGGDPQEHLFPVQYPALRQLLRRLGRRVLDRRVHPHLLRHSFATWLASKKVGRYQMCKVMGWAMSSDMPDRYINRTGVVEEEALAGIRGDKLAAAEGENRTLKASLTRLETQASELLERVAQQERQYALLDKLLADPRIAERVQALAGR